MPQPTEFGRRLKRFRERRGLSQNQLSKMARVPRATIGCVEAGVQEFVSLPAAVRLADSLGITLDALVRDPLASPDPTSDPPPVATASEPKAAPIARGDWRKQVTGLA